MKHNLRQSFSDAWRLFLNDIKQAKWAILVLVAYFAFFRYFFNSICPLVALTGFPCPACGLTRAGLQLLQFNFAAAWELHPFIYPVTVLILAFFFGRYIFRKRRMKILQRWTILVLMALVLFYVWRMYRFFPGEPPMSYYSGNLIAKFINLLHLQT